MDATLIYVNNMVIWPIEVTGVSVSPESATIEVDETKSLTVTVSPSQATNTGVTYSSNDETVATVSESGVVTWKKKWTATITATTVDGSFTDTCEITVEDKEE